MPNIQDWPHWFLVILLIGVLIAGWRLEKVYLAWLRRKSPWLINLKYFLAILAFGIVVIAIEMLINPPSKVRDEFQRAHPELFSKPAITSFKSSQ